MIIATILLVGVRDAAVADQLRNHGYQVARAADVESALPADEPYGLVLVSQESLAFSVDGALERLKFLGDGGRPVVLITDTVRLNGALLEALRAGALDYVFADEVALGLFCTRVDGLLLAARLDRGLLEAQASRHEAASLQQELQLSRSALEHQQAVNADIIASLACGLLIIDRRGIVQSANELAVDMITTGRAGLLGSPYRDVIQEPLRSLISRHHAVIAAGGQPVLQRLRAGRRYLEASLLPMRSHQGETLGLLALVTDVTEQEQTSLALQQAERLTTVGTMLSGVAHELRNPLSIISARAQRGLQKQDLDAEWVRKSFSSIVKQSERCATLVNNLLNFTRQSTAVAGHHQLAEIVEESLGYAAYDRSFASVAVVRELGPGLVVYGDRARFVQVFLNIVVNAVDAMDGSGTLTVRARPADGAVSVEFSDTGPGIDPSVQARVFDPFFTTKEPGRGTGLGLAIAHKIVTESGGSLRFESRPGHTTFFVQLPARGEEPS